MPPYPQMYERSQTFLLYWGQFIRLQGTPELYTGDASEDQWTEIDDFRRDVRESLIRLLAIKDETEDSFHTTKALEWLLGLILAWKIGLMSTPQIGPDGEMSWARDKEILEKVRRYGVDTTWTEEEVSFKKFFNQQLPTDTDKNGSNDIPVADEQFSLLKERIEREGYSNENRILLSNFKAAIKESGNLLLHIEIERYENKIDMETEIESKAMMEYISWANDNKNVSDVERRAKLSEFREEAQRKVFVEKGWQRIREMRSADSKQGSGQPIVSVPGGLIRGKGPQSVMVALREEGFSDGVIAYVLVRECGVTKIETGRLIRGEDSIEREDHKYYTRPVNDLLESVESLKIVIKD